MESKAFWPNLKVMILQDTTEGKKLKRQTLEEVLKYYTVCTGIGFVSRTRAARKQDQAERIVAKSSLVPKQPCKVMKQNRAKT